MPSSPAPDDALGLAEYVGTAALHRGRLYARQGRVRNPQVDAGPPIEVSGQVKGTTETPYVVTASLTLDQSGGITWLKSYCSCPMGSECTHVVALLVATLSAAPGEAQEPTRTLAAWEVALAPMVTPPTDVTNEDKLPLAIQFDLFLSDGPSWYRNRDGGPRVGIRPLRKGSRGKWIQGGIDWRNIAQYGRYGLDQVRDDHRTALANITAAATNRGNGLGFVSSNAHHYLDEVSGAVLWPLLLEAQAAGVAMINGDRWQSAAVLHASRGTAVIDISQTSEGLVVTPQVVVDGVSLAGLPTFDPPVDGADFEPPLRGLALLGDPAHGVVAWTGYPPDNIKLTFAMLDTPPPAAFRRLLTQGAVEVPEPERPRFLADYLPSITRRLPLRSADESFVPPVAEPPRLRLTIEAEPGHKLVLHWYWRYRTGSAVTDIPLSALSTLGTRDPAAEQALIASLDLTSPTFRQLAVNGRLRASRTLTQMDVVRFLSEQLPILQELPTIDVEIIGELLDYREAAAAPVVTIAGLEAKRDWYDFTVTVTVDEQSVPFVMLFHALATEQKTLILPTGTYFPLDHERFDQLRRLIEEARLLNDRPDGTVRVGKLQTSFFEELVSLGVLDDQAAAWREALRGLLPGDRVAAQPMPSSMHAELRPYQQAGFDWLSFLYRHGLGGVLADDMGLGKTVQSLTLICQARTAGPGDPPFLVVAPTSVVGNWAAECARFAPDLTVVTIGETARKRGTSMTELIAGADVVITSYALFRIDFDEYDALPWAGLLLDEAQFVKNHQSKAYQCAKRIEIPFKLVITGTPMENNLLELWAMFSLAAPGLFPSATRFADYYQRPIERGTHPELLSQLRRRIAPLMLRRTKGQVAPELPEKQEQTLELELNNKHRKVYQTHLARERQKILGLIGDMDKNRFAIFRSLTLLRLLSLDPSLIDESYGAVPSTKLDALMELLAETVIEGHRTLIFSQFTRFLGKVASRLDEAGIAFVYLDGSTRGRSKVLTEFKEGAAPVFLISLKAGGFGLNLTEADYVVLLDPWWNPATETQAIDRVHRIGQDKKVMVYRLVAKDTIEEKVMALRDTKAALFDSVMQGGDAAAGALSAADIRELLG